MEVVLLVIVMALVVVVVALPFMSECKCAGEGAKGMLDLKEEKVAKEHFFALTVTKIILRHVNTSSGLNELEINPVLDALMKY